MAADPTLVRGAYMAAGGGIDRTEHLKYIDQFSDKAFEQLNTIVKLSLIHI